MSLFRRNIIEQTFPSAHIYVVTNGTAFRSIAVLPNMSKNFQNGVLTSVVGHFAVGRDIGNYNYWCLRVQRISSGIDYFRITILCDCIIDGIKRNAGYTWNVTDRGTFAPVIYNIIALDKSYNNYAR